MKKLFALRNAAFIALLSAACCAGSANAYQLNAIGSNPLTFGVGATSSTVAEKMRITSTGLIGIGTATPTTALTISGTISATTFIGNGSGLTNLPAANLSETIAINDLSDASSSVAVGAVYLGNGSGGGASGFGNSAVGIKTLNATTSGAYNTATGYYAMVSNTTGSQNNAVGYKALAVNTTGTANNAVGFYALNGNTTASNNTGMGDYSLFTNSTGTYNAAFGSSAMFYSASGDYNAGLGAQTLFYNTTGSYNAATGFGALFANTTGYFNTAQGFKAGYFNTTGISNVAIGASAGYGVSNSTSFSNGTLVGSNSGLALTTGNANTFLGYYAGATTTTGSSNTLIGALAYAPSAATSNYLNIANVISGSGVQGGSMTFIGGIMANGVVTATYFEGDGSRLTNIAGSGGDRITSGTTNITVNSTGYTSLTTGGVTTGYLDTAGRLAIPAIGIGVAPTSTIPIYVSNSGTTFGLQLDGANNYAGVGFYRSGTQQGTIIQEATGNMYYTARTDNVFRAGGATERMRLTSAGYLGISTSAPTAPLHIYGTSLTDTYLTVGVGTSNLDGLNVGYGGGSFGQGISFLNAHSQSGSAGALRLLVDGTATMSLINGGKVGIGTTAPTNTLTISTSTVADGITIMSPGAVPINLNISNSLGQSTLGVASSANNYANGSLGGDTILRSLQSGTGTSNLILAALTTSGSIKFTTGALGSDVERLRISSAGLGVSASTQTGSNINLGFQDSTIEGAQVSWNASNAAYPGWITDVYANMFRVYNTSVSASAVNIFSTNNTVDLYVSGKIGVANTAPTVALDVSGAIVSRVYNASAATSFDWSRANAQYTTATCGAMTFTNMADGGTYSLLISNTTVGTCSFTHTGLTIKMPAGHGATTTGKTTLYGFTRFGTNVYTTWQPGY